MKRVRRLGAADHELSAWRRWMKALARARSRYYRQTDSDPLAVSEAAAVGLMLSAAGASGLIGLLEYPTEKRTNDERGWCYGRCDLWLTALRHEDGNGWAFEVKHQKLTARSSAAMVMRPFRAAWRDAGALSPLEGSKRIACTIYSSREELPLDSPAARTLRRLVGFSHVAWRLSDDDLPPVYILLRLRRRGRNRS